MRWIVSQIGARQHYATPRAFQLRDELGMFYTDSWSGRARHLLRKFPGRIRGLADRYTPDLPNEKVTARNLVSVWEQATFKFRVPEQNTVSLHNEWRREGERFARWVNRKLTRHPADPATDAFYGCKSVCLETLQLLNKQGVFTLVDQADPSRVEEELVKAEREKWPGWELLEGTTPQSYHDRCAAEWAAADVVLVYSDWTKEAIVSLGVPADKVVVVPLAFEPPALPADQAIPKKAGDRLTVLYLGAVMLRKGIQYLAEAARQLQDRPIDFVVGGILRISDDALKSFPPNIKYVGRVFRADIAKAYQSADLFVLPTISDSFAITQVEAMYNGLPVIATPRCGTVVTEGVDGMIVPPGDAGALAAAIAKLSEDRALLAAMSENSRKKAATFTLAGYGQKVFDEVVRRRPELARSE
jgi:glycosyltransferase involved in cell wall biosynthesis